MLLSIITLWMFRDFSPRRVDKMVSPAAAPVGGRLQPGPRHQRRAEDDGDHRRRAVHGRLPERRSRSRSGSSSRRTPPSPSGRSRAAGASCRRWARRSPSCSRSAASPPKPRGAARCSCQLARHPGEHHPHDHRRDRRRRRDHGRMSAVRWGVARQIVWAWILTIPASALDRRARLRSARALFGLA